MCEICHLILFQLTRMLCTLYRTLVMVKPSLVEVRTRTFTSGIMSLRPSGNIGELEEISHGSEVSNTSFFFSSVSKRMCYMHRATHVIRSVFKQNSPIKNT